MSRLTRDGTAEPVSRDQILRHARGQGDIIFLCSADHEQDWQPYPVDPYSAICDDHIVCSGQVGDFFFPLSVFYISPRIPSICRCMYYERYHFYLLLMLSQM